MVQPKEASLRLRNKMARILKINCKKNYLVDLEDEGLKLENMNFVDLKNYYGEKIAKSIFDSYPTLKDKERKHYDLFILDKTDLRVLLETKKLDIKNNKFLFLNSTLEERL